MIIFWTIYGIIAAIVLVLLMMFFRIFEGTYGMWRKTHMAIFYAIVWPYTVVYFYKRRKHG